MANNSYRLGNKNVTVPLSGMASDGNELLYAGMVGHKTALKSVWSTLVAARKSKKWLDLKRGWRWKASVRGSGETYHRLWKEMEMVAAYHLTIRDDRTVAVSAYQPFYALLFDPQAAIAGDEAEPYNRDEARLRAMPAIEFLVMAKLAAALKEPVQLSWADYLWEKATSTRSGGGLVHITTYGDCLTGVRVNPLFDWARLIANGIKNGEIAIAGDEEEERLIEEMVPVLKQYGYSLAGISPDAD